MSQLDKIIADKRVEIEGRREKVSLEYLKSTASIRRQQPDFIESLRSSPMGLIAEIKRQSPSAGEIRPGMRPDHIAEQYEQAGAQAISILVDQKYFGAEEADFVMVRDAVSLPILYKEFVLYGWQVWHAASLGASAVLLIAAALEDEELSELLDLTTKAGMTPLLEVHTADEMKRACDLGASCIGVNNRDLGTFKVSLATSCELIADAPKDATLISESGIKTAEDVVRMHDAGFHGILVGEHILRQEKVGPAIHELMSGVWASS